MNVNLTKENLNEARETLSIAKSAAKEASMAKTLASEAQSMLDDLSLLVDVNAAAIRAPHDVKEFRKLLAISKGSKDRIGVIAEKQVELILNQLRADYKMVKDDYWGLKGKKIPRYYGFEGDMEGWGRTEFVRNYSKVPNDRKIVYVMQFLSDPRETDDEKLIFSYYILESESKPDVIYTICAFVNEKAKINKDFLLGTEDYLRWLKGKYGDSVTSKVSAAPVGE